MAPVYTEAMYNYIEFTDEELVSLLVEGNTFTEVGQLAGVSRERIRQLFTRRLYKLMPPELQTPSGREFRQRLQERARTLCVYGFVAEVAKVAHQKGLIVQAVAVAGRTKKASRRALLINGHLCRVSHLRGQPTFASSHSLVPYWHTSVPTNPFEYWIIDTPEGFFIIPKSVIPFGMRTIYIREGGPSTYEKAAQPKLQAWDYYERWDLLEEKKDGLNGVAEAARLVHRGPDSGSGNEEGSRTTEEANT